MFTSLGTVLNCYDEDLSLSYYVMGSTRLLQELM